MQIIRKKQSERRLCRTDVAATLFLNLHNPKIDVLKCKIGSFSNSCYVNSSPRSKCQNVKFPRHQSNCKKCQTESPFKLLKCKIVKLLRCKIAFLLLFINTVYELAGSHKVGVPKKIPGPSADSCDRKRIPGPIN